MRPLLACDACLLRNGLDFALLRLFIYFTTIPSQFLTTIFPLYRPEKHILHIIIKQSFNSVFKNLIYKNSEV